MKLRMIGLFAALLFVVCVAGAASAAPPAAAAPANGNAKLLTCGDFFKSAELTALGLDAARYKEDTAQPGPDLGVRCRFGQVSAVIIRRSHLTNVADDEKLSKESGVPFKLGDGPKLGSESRWTVVAGLDTLNFVSSNKHFVCVASSRDRALLLKLARALDAKLNQL